MSEAEARRGPNRSQALPMAILAKTAPETDAIPALPISVAVRLRLSRMTGMRGGAAKLKELKQKIRSWNRDVFGRLEFNKKSALQRVEFWDLVESERSLSEEET